MFRILDPAEKVYVRQVRALHSPTASVSRVSRCPAVSIGPWSEPTEISRTRFLDALE